MLHYFRHLSRLQAINRVLSAMCHTDFDSSLLFVHGLGANPDTTWCAGAVTGASPELSTKSCCWITDLLPDDLKAEGLNKHVRLFTFNYDSFWMREANSTRLAELGRILLQELLNGKVGYRLVHYTGECI